jgi:hypothetical protein
MRSTTSLFNHDSQSLIAKTLMATPNHQEQQVDIETKSNYYEFISIISYTQFIAIGIYSKYLIRVVKLDSEKDIKKEAKRLIKRK